MSAVSIGRIVTKIMGREAGSKAVVTQLIDNKFVEISGPQELTGVKRRRVNISHIEPTEFTLAITAENNSDETILDLINKENDLKAVFEARL